MAVAPGLQTPYVIAGRVRLNIRASGADVNTNQRGALIWAEDMTEGTFKYREENISMVHTNTEGEYIIDVANITSAYSQGDRVRIYCKLGDETDWQDVILVTQIGVTFLNFTFPNKSGLKDGLKGTLNDDGLYGLESMGKGMKKGLQDGM